MPIGAVPFPFGDCRICNDKATGVHYGVATCEGCKGFFRRSIPKGEKYKCFFAGQCVISPQNRNRCKSCRFRKCLERGMAIDAVKMGRIPKIEKEKALEAARNCPSVEHTNIPFGNCDDSEMNFQNNNLSDMIPPLQQHIKQEPESSFSSCDKPEVLNSSCSFDHQDSYNSLHIPTLWQTFNPGSIEAQTKIDPYSSNTSSSSMYEDSDYTHIPNNICTPGSDESSCSSNSRLHYSPDVIKMLFDQAVEKRGGRQIKDQILRHLVDHCPDNHYVDSSIKVLQSLSTSNGSLPSILHPDDPNAIPDETWEDEHENIDSPPPSAVDMRLISSMNFSINNIPTVPQFPTTSTNVHNQNGCHSSHIAEMHISENNTVPSYRHPYHQDQTLQSVTNSNPTNYTMLSSAQTFKSDLNTDSNLTTSNTSTASPYSDDTDNKVPTSESPSIFDSDYYLKTSKCKHYVMEDIYVMVKRSNKKKAEMADWMTKTVNQIEKALDTYHKHLRENRIFVQEFLKNKRKLPVETKTPETLKETWNLIINGISIVNYRIIGFCNSVPGFASLCAEDQQPMLKQAYYSIWMLTTSEFFINGDSYLRFSNGRFYTRFWMQNFISEKRLAHIFCFVENFNKLKLTETEVAILAAVQLMTYDNDELVLSNAQSVQILNVHYVDILVQLLCESHPNNVCQTLLEIFNLFPHLLYINKMQRDMVTEFLLDKHPIPDKELTSTEEENS